ncbi:MAG TPA: DNA cytosine methyltransferase, partial [Caldisericia bacterium]|nr:DNA cytosine methyltransferase [Caldisericia bacterium]
VKSNGFYKIRKLTPKECFRLMGLTDQEIEIIQATGISNSQQYKMAGNSIVVNCLTEIFKNLKEIIENV